MCLVVRVLGLTLLDVEISEGDDVEPERITDFGADRTVYAERDEDGGTDNRFGFRR